MSDQEASNAVVTLVRFYSGALAYMTAERDELARTLKAVLAKGHRPAPPWQKVCRAADDYIEAQHTGDAASRQKTLEELDRLVHDLRRYEMDRVEPDPPREGEVRGAPADGDADVPG